MKFGKLFGNILIITGLCGILYTFFPLAQAYIQPPQSTVEKNIKTNLTIYIPKIGAYANIITNVDPVDESIYNEALKKGIARARGTALPGGRGTSFLFAHSSAPPWENTRFNSVFLRLNELERGDLIAIRNKDKEFKYEVYDKKEVWPDEVKYLNRSDKDELILQTCTPIGTSLKRLLVFASIAP